MSQFYKQNNQYRPQQQSVPVPRGKKPANPKGNGGGGMRWRIILGTAMVLVFAVIAFFGIRYLRDRQVAQSIAAYQRVYAPNVFINDIALSGLTPQEALDTLQATIQERISSWNLSITYRGHVFTSLNYGTLGLTVSTDELYQLLNEAWALSHSGTVHEQKAAIDLLAVTAHKAYTSKTDPDSSQLQSMLQQIAPYVNAAPVDAALLVFQPDAANPFVFQDDRPGASLDIDAAQDSILNMAASGISGSYELSPEIIPPKVSRKELEETVHLRSSIVTPIDSSSTENRNHNIRMSFSKINGLVLKPGQTFSFNDVVGSRTLESGFAEALEYAYGDLVYGIGGGVCQASTTLYQAAITGGLTIQERYPHSGKVNYTEMGQDATVYFTRDREIDFRFRNTTPSSIYITAHVRPATSSAKRLVAEIKLYGLSLGDGVSYRLRSVVVETLSPPAEKKYVVDKTGLVVKYTDQEKLKTPAQDGYVIETYLEKYQNGSLMDQPKLVSSDTFLPKAAEYWKGETTRI
jgi:vancomycin resistance protein YoaR